MPIRLAASLPLVSIVAFVRLHLQGTAPARIGQRLIDILWLTMHSCALLVALPRRAVCYMERGCREFPGVGRWLTCKPQKL